MSTVLSGLRAWLVQRASAVYMLGFLLVVLGRFTFDPPATFAAWHGWIANPVMRIAILVFTLSLILHAWVGVRDVSLDYVRPMALRTVVLALFALALSALGLWLAQILLTL